MFTQQRIKRQIPVTIVAASLAATIASGAALGGQTVNGPMAFEPIAGSAYGQTTDDWGNTPWIIPDGFSQYLVSDEINDLGGGGGLDIYPGVDDLTDMNTVNETGKFAGRYLYRTHERGADGAVSVVDLQTGASKVLVQQGDVVDETGLPWRVLDGLAWTPWGTLLFAEERAQGHLFEIVLDSQDPSTPVAVYDRPAVGLIRHEGIEVGPDGAVYVVDELNGGSIFRFVPDSYGDLSSGQLHALKISGISDADQIWDSGNDRTGAFEWVALDQDQAMIDAKIAADAVNATEYGRPEDVELIDSILYVANTTEERVIAIDLDSNTVATFVEAGFNVPIENSGASVTGFNNPDNLADGPDGRLWIVEDNFASDIWVADKDLDGDGAADGVNLFASLKDSAAEGTGIYFGKDPRTLFVNLQHTAADRDGTWAITNRP